MDGIAKPIPPGKSEPLTDIEKQTIIRWIDLGVRRIAGPDASRKQKHAHEYETRSTNGRFLGILTLVTAATSWSWADEPPVPIFTDVTGQAGIVFKHSFGDPELSNIVEGTGAGVHVLRL